MSENEGSLRNELSQLLEITPLNTYWEMVTQYRQGPSKIQNWHSIMTPDAGSLPDFSSLLSPDDSKTAAKRPSRGANRDDPKGVCVRVGVDRASRRP